MDVKGVVVVPAALVNSPMDVTPEYLLTVVSKAEEPESVIVTAGIAGQLSPTHRARASEDPLACARGCGKRVHPGAVTLAMVWLVVFQATPTTTASPAVVEARGEHDWLGVIPNASAQMVADPPT
jgi:hypothetical protein